MEQSESAIEKYLDMKVREHGGETRKYVSPGHVGVADRLCFFPGGVIFLVEVKNNRGEETTSQCRERKKMINLGQRAVVVFGKKGIDKWLDSIIVDLI